MKKIMMVIMAMVMVLSLVACGNNSSTEDSTSEIIGETSFPDTTFEVNGNSVELYFYDIEDNFVLDISESYGDGSMFYIYGTDEITEDIIEHRTQSDGIIIERCIGIVTNEENIGDGKILNTDDDCYNYISYKGVDFEINEGTIILTYLVYNPGTDEVDDIMERYDFVLSREYED